MPTDLPLPGAPRQQSLLKTIAALYTEDSRVLAALVFGSLGRGNGDAYSDLDLAVVIREDVQIDIRSELDRIGAALAAHGEHALVSQVAWEDGYLLLQSLTGIALCYHRLQAMSPYVLEGYHVLCGSLDTETIRVAAQANDHPGLAPSQELHRALWLALGADIALQRRQFWRALPWLEPMRGALLKIFAASHGGKRAYQVFELEASAELQAKLGRTLPQYFPASPMESARALSEALTALLDLIEYDLDELSNGQVQLGPGEREVIDRLRARQAVLDDAAD